MRVVSHRVKQKSTLETGVEPVMLAVELTIGLPATAFTMRYYGLRRASLFAAGMGAACAVEHLFIRRIAARTGAEKSTAADAITMVRATAASALAGLAASGVRDRLGPAGWAAWLATLLTGSVGDWVDGPVARHVGPTRMGAVLDIEADSWLTLWSSVAAVLWADLPVFCLGPPVARYLIPSVDIARGGVPQGSGAWWVRVTGVAQMALFIGAMAPFRKRPPREMWAIPAAIVSGAQAATIVATLREQLKK